MAWDYQSELYPLFRLDYDEGMFAEQLRDYTLEELYQKARYLDARITEMRAKEPPKKRDNKNQYRLWVGITYDLIYEYNKVCEEIKRKKNDN